MGISEADKYLEENPHIERLVNGAPLIADAMRVGMKKPDTLFRERLKDIKKRHKGSTVNDF